MHVYALTKASAAEMETFKPVDVYDLLLTKPTLFDAASKAMAEGAAQCVRLHEELNGPGTSWPPPRLPLWTQSDDDEWTLDFNAAQTVWRVYRVEVR